MIENDQTLKFSAEYINNFTGLLLYEVMIDAYTDFNPADTTKES